MVCARCGSKRVEWAEFINPNGFKQWRLYEVDTGAWHNANCRITVTDLQKKKETKNKKVACKHGILLDRWCERCNE